MHKLRSDGTSAIEQSAIFRLLDNCRAVAVPARAPLGVGVALLHRAGAEGSLMGGRLSSMLGTCLILCASAQVNAQAERGKAAGSLLRRAANGTLRARSEEHTSELQCNRGLVCRV